MASRGVNRVILLGNLGADPEVRTSPNGSVIANLRIATGEAWKDQQGQLQERTEWHRVIVFGKSAEVAQQYLRKGSKVYLEGRIQTRKWQDKEGKDQYTTEIVTQGFQMLDRKEDSGQGGYQQQTPANPAQALYGQRQSYTNAQGQPEVGGFDDSDIPFMRVMGPW